MNHHPAKQILPRLVVFLLCFAVGNDLLANGTNLPPVAAVKIDFDRDIHPIFQESCLRCHGPQKPRSGFRLDYRPSALAGGDNDTNDIVPGDSAKSLLIAYVARQVPDMEMPPNGKGAPLTPQQVSLLRVWIDQGANWSATNQPLPLEITFEPTLQWFGVSGNQQKFSELEGAKSGWGGGVDEFSAIKQINPTETVSVEGHVLVPNDDFDLKLSLDKNDLGFIHAGFDQWRKYYATDGGYDPTITPPGLDFNRDLYVDNGRAWVDLGLDLPRWPEIILGYEYDYRKGNESTLAWGFANGKNIYPATQGIDEQTHSIKLDVSKDLDDWHLENNARVDFYFQNDQGMEAANLLGGISADQTVNTQDHYRQIQGMDTFTVEKQISDWWFFDGGLYYSRLSGSDFFSQTTAIPAFSVNNVLASQQIMLSRQSEIFSIGNLFSPLDHLTYSLGLQNEWDSERGFGESIPDLELGGNIPANSSLHETKNSLDSSLRYSGIPFSLIFGDAQLGADNYTINQVENTDELQNQTVANNLRYDLKAGFSTSPWVWGDLTAQYERQSSDTDYNHLADLFNGLSGPTNGYPAFILGRDIMTDQFKTELALHPARWLKTTLTYQLTSTDYKSTTDPAYDPNLMESVSDGGFIVDGRYHLQTYGINATLTPFRQLYLSGAFTFSQSRLTTFNNGDPSIVPYRGNIFTANTTATYAWNLKTTLQLSYVFTRANYGENNGAAGVPMGLDFTRNDLIFGLTRQLSKKLSARLQYEFSQYLEPSGGDINNFTAHGIFATLSYKGF
ncbi:MAG TPA: c-type cytochrome domain-containing protein [Verrucomicrobiae bacterium]|jgi:hypothetical protein